MQGKQAKPASSAPDLCPRSPELVVRPSLRQRFEFQAARLLLALPDAIQMRLSGRAPVVVEGCTLHPQMQLLLSLRARWRGRSMIRKSSAQARLEFQSDSLTIAGPRIALGAVTDLAIDGGTRKIPARHYAPAASRPRPLLVYFHGGGFVAGDLDSHDTLCRRLCRDADIHVLAIAYRLAPEHPFPAAVDDAFAAFRWACEYSTTLGALHDRIAVGGDSAGGNLAAVVSQKAAADGGAVPCAQVLLYPAVDRTAMRPSLELFADGFLLTRSDIDWYLLQYTGSTVPRPDPAQNPLCADDLSGLAPALIVTAGFDPLRDEGEAYAAALRAAGVPVTMLRFESLLHGFCSMATISPACDAALRNIAAEVRAIMATGTAVAPQMRTIR